MSGKLDDRLVAVADRIRSGTHADIGSDHASLLVELLVSGRIQHGIAIENKQLPFENSLRALRGLAADVRLGDGLHALQRGEAYSLSICGLGAESIRDILLACPDRIPDLVVLQIFHRPEIIRRWAVENGFHLTQETTTAGKRHYTILSFRRSHGPENSDPAYDNVDRETALLFGPFVLKREDRQFDLHLQCEEAWWRKFDQLSAETAQRLKLLRSVMADRQVAPLPDRNQS
ncbi:tRNA (adenine(22)-N(1))-methyltransferase [Mariniblastus fucicola]|uniref:tRNA (Adenine(22)-N(1))-methyltransferase n=1 Tax=Mariniblastus fucicola TaxID=980251 RepID=A0A5B9PFU5_9BACT|nr:class I SAM-dependent methyltransferase [Mariniblastus fucicola]QEG25194.1 tRNA (adenine(22)-N(1))-methyltransferase [Mariniblastus fucicola]